MIECQTAIADDNEGRDAAMDRHDGEQPLFRQLKWNLPDTEATEKTSRWNLLCRMGIPARPKRKKKT